MKSKILFILILSLAWSIPNHGQTVLASAGGSFERDHVLLEWTLGETVIPTLSSASCILTQGFHQGSVMISSVNLNPDKLQGIAVYPNPVGDFLTLAIESDDPGMIEAEVIDITGRIIIKSMEYRAPCRIDFSHVNPGLYQLVVRSRNPAHCQTFKVLKY